MALLGCTPGATPGPQTTAAKTPGAGDNHGVETSASSPPNPGETRAPPPPAWGHLEPKGADEATQKRARATCEERTPKSAPGAPELLACVWLGASKLSEGEQRQALKYFRAACEAGQALGCVGEGDVLMRGGVAVTGKGVLRQPAAAEAAWKKACELGAKSGCWLLVRLLERGGDLDRAQEYRKKACDLGMVAACARRSE